MAADGLRRERDALPDVSRVTRWRWRTQRAMPHYRLGRSILVRQSEIEAWGRLRSRRGVQMVAEESELAKSVQEAKQAAKAQGVEPVPFEGALIGTCHILESGGKRYLACEYQSILELLRLVAEGAPEAPEVPDAE